MVDQSSTIDRQLNELNAFITKHSNKVNKDEEHFEIFREGVNNLLRSLKILPNKIKLYHSITISNVVNSKCEKHILYPMFGEIKSKVTPKDTNRDLFTEISFDERIVEVYNGTLYVMVMFEENISLDLSDYLCDNALVVLKNCLDINSLFLPDCPVSLTFESCSLSSNFQIDGGEITDLNLLDCFFHKSDRQLIKSKKLTISNTTGTEHAVLSSYVDDLKVNCTNLDFEMSTIYFQEQCCNVTRLVSNVYVRLEYFSKLENLDYQYETTQFLKPNKSLKTVKLSNSQLCLNTSDYPKLEKLTVSQLNNVHLTTTLRKVSVVSNGIFSFKEFTRPDKLSFVLEQDDITYKSTIAFS